MAQMHVQDMAQELAKKPNQLAMAPVIALGSKEDKATHEHTREETTSANLFPSIYRSKVPLPR